MNFNNYLKSDEPLRIYNIYVRNEELLKDEIRENYYFHSCKLMENKKMKPMVQKSGSEIFSFLDSTKKRVIFFVQMEAVLYFSNWLF